VGVRKEQVTIQGEEVLEGILEFSDVGLEGGVVISHPHPLHGGTMLNPVVHHMARGCQAHGLATLRFNFRGVGGSGGSYGRYEEYKDVSAAARFLKDRLGQSAGIVLGGYSFGAAMSALAVARDKEGLEDVAGLALVAFAVRWEEFRATAFEGLSRYHGPVLALSGEDDPIAPPAEVADFLSGLGLDLREERLVGEDHMLGRSHKELEKHVGDFAATALDEWKGEVE